MPKLDTKHILLIISLFFLFSCNKNTAKKDQPFAIVLHAGAGKILPKNMSAKQKEQYYNILRKAINRGYFIIENGGTALNAVQKTINLLEDSPLFNAGKGAVFDSQGKNKMDASIMDGYTLNTGAVAGVSNIKNPINAARLVMDSSKHVLLSGKGAEIFAQQHDIKFEKDDYFYTENAYKSWQNIRNNEKKKQYSVNHIELNSNKTSTGSAFKNQLMVNDTLASSVFENLEKYKNLNLNLKPKTHFGTVGVVVLDKSGHIAAGTSTGGLTYKKYGRIGDSPIIGAGTYANNKTCGVSCTGVGEYYIRTLAAHEVSSLIQYKNLTAKQAANEVIHNQIAKLGGLGGIIILDKNANIAWNFNTEGMYRAYKKSNGDSKVELFSLAVENKNHIEK